MTILYDQDFQLWLSQTINQLENQQFEQLDIEHLIEELTDLGKSNKRSLESNLIILITPSHWYEALANVANNPVESLAS